MLNWKTRRIAKQCMAIAEIGCVSVVLRVRPPGERESDGVMAVVCMSCGRDPSGAQMDVYKGRLEKGQFGMFGLVAMACLARPAEVYNERMEMVLFGMFGPVARASF